MTMHVKEVEIKRLKKIVVDKWKGNMAAYERLTIEIWFEITDSERVRMIYNVTNLIDFKVERGAALDERLAGKTLSQETQKGN